eukprot:TRINITY_DN1617_c0_g1_i2.p1 TRINITY_DN1617_c0_g1~~TRINITY_DN1617_c0_g1_i2.p1  ORF type:complete len:235 (+),score=86.91 TRINITY_DN1617_c0_g1_i2:55-705(+)
MPIHSLSSNPNPLSYFNRPENQILFPDMYHQEQSIHIRRKQMKLQREMKREEGVIAPSKEMRLGKQEKINYDRTKAKKLIKLRQLQWRYEALISQQLKQSSADPAPNAKLSALKRRRTIVEDVVQDAIQPCGDDVLGCLLAQHDLVRQRQDRDRMPLSKEQKRLKSKIAAIKSAYPSLCLSPFPICPVSSLFASPPQQQQSPQFSEQRQAHWAATF